jgi:hypothetical protein
MIEIGMNDIQGPTMGAFLKHTMIVSALAVLQLALKRLCGIVRGGLLR